MTTPRKLGLAAAVLFVISHCLPAFGDGSGFACFQLCWSVLWGQDGEVLAGGWFYYSGFAIANILFPVLVVALFVTRKGRWLRALASVVFLLHVLSWLVLHVFQSPHEIHKIKIGYYLWLVAYGVLVAAHLRKEPGKSLEAVPIARSSDTPRMTK